MPELPEVETIARDLQRLVGLVIEDARADWPGSISDLEPAAFDAAVRHRQIERVGRRAKNIVIWLSGDAVLTVHLRMTGRLILRESGAAAERFQRVAIRFRGGRELRFADARKFGRLALKSTAALADLEARLGPEPLADTFTLEIFRAMLQRKRGNVKSALLDQRFLSGVGNIYADETLFAARIHPSASLPSLSEVEIARLHAALRRVLTDAIGNRGTSFSDYLDAEGLRGGNQDHLMVYRRTGQPCLVCATPIERRASSGRGTHFCPRCQAPTRAS